MQADDAIDTEKLKARYEAVKYTGRVYRLTHPDRLAMVAKLRGLEPPPVETARVLELGCGTGMNIVSMAHHLPAAQLVGLDLSATILAEGRTCAEELGLDNVHLVAGAIEDLPDFTALHPAFADGRFDYIVTHGVYSWITDEARDAIMSVIRRLLAPQGVAYVSYNTLPGWHYRMQARDIMRWHGSRFEDPETQISQGRLMLDFIVKGLDTEVSLYGRLLRRTLENLDDASSEYLFHDYHAPINRPIYVTEFFEHAERHGLQVLGEASFGDMALARVPDAFHGALRDLEDEPVRYHQLVDHIRCTGFRRTLVTHGELPLTQAEPVDALAGTTVLMQARLGSVLNYDKRVPCTVTTRDETELTVHDPVTKAALVELYERYPAALAPEELLARAHARLRAQRKRSSASLEAFSKTLLDLFALEVVDVLPRRVPVGLEAGERPTVNRLARWEAARGAEGVSNAYHERVESRGVERVLIRSCDGTRTLDDLADEVVKAVQSGELVLHIGDEATEDAELTRDVAAAVVRDKVRLLPSVGLLVPAAASAR